MRHEDDEGGPYDRLKHRALKERGEGPRDRVAGPGLKPPDAAGAKGAGREWSDNRGRENLSGVSQEGERK